MNRGVRLAPGRYSDRQRNPAAGRRLENAAQPKRLSPYNSVCRAEWQTSRLVEILDTDISLGSGDVDPDPFSVGISIMALIFAGGSYLEARRTKQVAGAQARSDFRAAWFNSRRTLIHARRIVEEFNTYVSEDNFGRTEFGFGRIRLQIDRGRAQQLRRLHGNANITAEHMADDLDRLADHLDTRYQNRIDAILALLTEVKQFPENYRDVVTTGRKALDPYEGLINEVGDREDLEQAN